MCRKTMVVSILLSLLLTISLFAQVTTGDIRGIVRDPSGAIVSGAKVQIINVDQGATVRTLTTNPDGSYVAAALPVGKYRVVVNAPGFATYTADDVVLNINGRRVIDVALKVGSTGQTVNVQESPVQVNLDNPTAEGVINGTQIRDLAVLSRNFVQLVTLQPGVSSDMASDQMYVGASNPTGSSNQINISINGSRPSQNEWLVDGADNLDRGSNLILLSAPSVDSIDEFKVLRSNFLPEHGRTSSGEVSVVTRSGSNSFHGTAYEFFRNDKLNANNYFNNKAGIQRPPMRWNDFGYTIGGPIKKDNTFFFFSQEWRRFITYTSFTSDVLPTQAEMGGNFPFPVCTTFDATGTCTATGTSITNINPVAAGYIQDIYSKLPAANLGSKLISNGRNLYYYREEAVRIDHRFGDKVSIFGRYSHDSIPTQEPGGLYNGGFPLPGVATTNSNTPAHIGTLHVTATFSPTVVNEAGYTYTWGAVTSSPIGLMALANSPDVRPTLPYATNAGNVPSIGFYQGQGLNGSGPFNFVNRIQNFFDTLAWNRGNHALKFGGVYSRYHKDDMGYNNASFTINDAAGCGAGSPADCAAADATFEQNWANFLLGRVYNFSEAQSTIHNLLNVNQFEFFGQDEWRVRSNLTVDYGVRWSLFGSPTAPNNVLSTFDPNLYNKAAAPAIDPTTGNYFTAVDPTTLPGLIQAGVNSPYGQAVVPMQKNAIAPRLGFAWDPFGTGNTSIRGGYGMFYGVFSLDNHTYSQEFNPNWSPALANYRNTNLSAPTGTSTGTTTTITPPTIFGPNPARWKIPYTHQWNFDVQQQLGHSMVLDVGYYGNAGRHLMGVVDINMPQPLAFRNIPGYCASYTDNPCYFHALGNSGYDTQFLNYVRPYPGYDAINLATPDYTSSYNGLQAQFQKQFSNSSQIVVNYTWSHDLTDASENFRGARYSYDLKSDWGNSIFDRRHVLSASYVYFLPWMKTQQGFAGHILGGWELSGVVYLTSGRHYDPTTSSCREDFVGLGTCGNSWAGDRPDMIADPNSNAPHTIDQWFNTSAFVNVGCDATNPRCTPTNPPLRQGNAVRGSILGPGVKRWDASIFKNTKVGERVTAQFRAEFFNALNNVNLAEGTPIVGMSTNRNSGLFGQILNARDPRQIQLAMKLIF